MGKGWFFSWQNPESGHLNSESVYGKGSCHSPQRNLKTPYKGEIQPEKNAGENEGRGAEYWVKPHREVSRLRTFRLQHRSLSGTVFPTPLQRCQRTSHDARELCSAGWSAGWRASLRQGQHFLLSFNLHTGKGTDLECRVWWSLTIVCTLVTTIPIRTENISINPESLYFATFQAMPPLTTQKQPHPSF